MPEADARLYQGVPSCCGHRAYACMHLPAVLPKPMRTQTPRSFCTLSCTRPQHPDVGLPPSTVRMHAGICYLRPPGHACGDDLDCAYVQVHFKVEHGVYGPQAGRGADAFTMWREAVINTVNNAVAQWCEQNNIVTRNVTLIPGEPHSMLLREGKIPQWFQNVAPPGAAGV